MRFVFGIIVGCLLTVAVAYVHDAAVPAGPVSAATDPAIGAAVSDGRMVNWEVVSHDLQGVNGWVQTQWAWINAKFNKSA